MFCSKVKFTFREVRQPTKAVLKLYLKDVYKFCIAFLPALSIQVNITCIPKESTGNFSPVSFFKVHLVVLIN